MQPPSEHTGSRWQNVVSKSTVDDDSLRAFLVGPTSERIKSVRQGLAKPNERAAALRVLPHMTVNERMELFADLVRLASCGHGLIQSVRDAIASLPRGWVLARVESVAEPLLVGSSEADQYEEYRRLLELYEQLGDVGLVCRLAQRALDHRDGDVRDAGREFLGRHT